MSRQIKVVSALITAFVLASAAGAFAESHVRIVRLSYLNGPVQVDRAVGQGLERGILNTPIVEGTRIVTGTDGLAEVEFENASALRIAEDTDIQFRTLSMNSNGAKVNEIEVVKGVVYLDARSKGDDIYRMRTGDLSFVVQRDTQLRLSASSDQTQVAVFKGNVELMDQPQMVNVKKKETLTIDRKNPTEYKVAMGTEAFPADTWNRERAAYQEAYNTNPGNPGPRSGYGLQDLNYYGSFFMANGYGYVWQPYGFANSMNAWDPYSAGAWMYSPGFGYGFASSYPWGWLPYHYGSWAYLNGIGWAWLPGGGYGGNWYNNRFQAAPVVAKAPAGWTAPAAPAVVADQSVKPTVLVGKVSSTAIVPGGRMPPDFGGVIHGSGVAASATGNGFARANVQDHAINDKAFATRYNAFDTRGAKSTHVFAAPPPVAVVASPAAVGPGYSASSAGSMGSPAAAGGHASSSSAHASGPSHH
jgi:hypothetical protein